MSGEPVFVTGGTGYLGSVLIEALLARGYPVHALARRGSEARLPRGAQAVIGNALESETFAAAIPARASMVHFVGTPHPNPSKAAEFTRVDLGSIRATANAAKHAHASHIVYVSVAHPAPVMHAYIAARVEGEALVAATGIAATILRPWYVLGTGASLANRPHAALRALAAHSCDARVGATARARHAHADRRRARSRHRESAALGCAHCRSARDHARGPLTRAAHSDKVCRCVGTSPARRESPGHRAQPRRTT